jgi:hypothetical protein
VADDRRARLQALNRLKALLDGDYITYFPSLTPLCGSHKAAALLSVAVIWTRNWLRHHPERDGWFWKTRAEWQRETGLSRHEQESARRALVAAGLIQEARRGMPARLHFRVDLDRLAARLAEAAQASLTAWDWDDPLLRRLLGRPAALYRRLALVAGSLSGGLLLSHLLLTCRKDLALGGSSTGWLNYYPDLIGRHCRLTRHEVDGARTRLAGQGLLEARWASGLPARRVVRPRLDRLLAALEDWSRRDWRTQHDSLAPCANQGMDEPAIQPGASRHPGHGQTGQLGFDEVADRESANRPTSWPLSGNSPSGANPHPSGPGGRPRARAKHCKKLTPYPPPAPSPVMPAEVPIARTKDVGGVGKRVPPKSEPPLVFSGTLLPSEQAVARTWLAELAPDLRQLVLDEHAGMVRGREIRNPLGYLHTLVRVARAGRFMPTIAYRVAQARQEAEARAAAQRQAREALRQSPDPAARLAAREHLARMRAQLGMGMQGAGR